MRRRVVHAALALAAFACIGAVSAPNSPVAIEATGRYDLLANVPLVAENPNARVPGPGLTMRIAGEAALPAATVVTWSTPDGKNVFVEGTGDGPRRETLENVGPPVNQRTTLRVRDVDAIGFGCYGFIASGPSVRFEGTRPLRSTLADADVAVLGPGRLEGTLPAYGCWGENYDAATTSYRLVFAHGARLLEPGVRPQFVKTLPFDAVDAKTPLDVRTHEDRIVRLHLIPGAGTYFTGWTEEIEPQTP